MKYYLHFESGTGKFAGWYNDELHSVIPEPYLEVTKEEYETYLDLMNMQAKQLLIVNGKVIIQNYVIIETWETIRDRRNEKLNGTDWTQLPDIPESTRSRYAMYRQALRDIPQRYTDPNSIMWPKPSDYGIEE